MRLVSSPIVVSTIATLVAASANATPITFTVDSGSGTPIGVSPGTTVTVSPATGLAGTSFNLDADGGPTSKTFDFLDVTIGGNGLAVGVIDAVLNFSSPTPIFGTADGILGGFAVVLGVGSAGVLTVLDDPGPIAFGQGGLFDVDFIGFANACLDCSSISGTVQAKVTLLKPTSVPEPGTISLLGVGLAAIALSRRRRNLGSAAQ